MFGFGQSALSQYLTGAIPLNLNVLLQFASVMGCPPEAISPNLAAEIRGFHQKENGENYTPLPPEMFEWGGQATEAFLQAVPRLKIENRYVPLLTYEEADKLTKPNSNFVGDAAAYLSTDVNLSARAFALAVTDDSMLPRFEPGDRVIVDQDVKPVAGDFVVASDGSAAATFRKYRPRGLNESGQEVFELVPLNDDHPALYSDRQALTVIGTMLEHRRYRRR
jgi:SOS-response transcriptional repressor LexA